MNLVIQCGKATVFILTVTLFFALIPNVSAVEPLHFVFFNPDNQAKDPLTAVSAMKPFTDYIKEDIGREIQIHYLLKKKDLERWMHREKISLALLSPLYVVENKDKYGLEPFAIPFVGADITYTLKLVVKKSENVSSLKELKGKSLAYTALGEENYNFLNKLVFNGEVDVTTYFSKLIEVTSPSSAVMSVLYDQADCACVTGGLYDTLKELNPQVARETVVVYESPKILNSPMCFVKNNMSAEYKSKIRKILLNMHKTPLGQQTLMPFKVEGFKPTDISVFKPMERMLAQAGGKLSRNSLGERKEKPKVERVADVTAIAASGLTITRIKEKYEKSSETVKVHATITPAKAVATSKLIYAIEGKAKQTVPFKKINAKTYVASIHLPERKAAETKGAKEEIYIVKPGDTLGKISKKYYGEIKKWIMIATYNQLPNPNLILIGQKLKIKLSGAFENVKIDCWVQAESTKGKIITSPKKTIIVTR